PRRSTTTPAPAAKTTPTPFASSPVPGSASYGAAGSTAPPTTPPTTQPQPRSSSRKPHEVDTGGVMRAGRPEAPDDLIERDVAARMQRQEIFAREHPPSAWFIVDE